MPRAPKPSPGADLADDLLDAVAGFRRAARRVAPSPMGQFTGAEIELMGLVRRQPGLSVSEAAASLGLAVNTVSTLVGRLVAARMLVRTADAGDRRVARLRLTPAAARRIDAARARRVVAVTDAVDRLPPAHRARAAAAVRVLRHLADVLAEPGGP